VSEDDEDDDRERLKKLMCRGTRRREASHLRDKETLSSSFHS